MQYTEAVEYILSIPKFTSKNSLENTRHLLDILGNPQDTFKIIHVAGTNGKGSVCAYLSSILTESGKAAGFFSSPHLVRINERFRLRGVPVTDELFMEGFYTARSAVRHMQEEGFPHPTFFEFLFAMAMVIFKQARMEYVLLETGIGGRLDATNAISDPCAVVLTTIGLDHMEILGNTIGQIAAEKAAIIKPGIPVIYDARSEEAGEVIRQEAKEKQALLYPLNQDMYKIFINENKSVDFTLETEYSEYIHFQLGTVGRYQAVNASLALLTLDALQLTEELEEAAVRTGISNMVWPGRMEQVMPGVILDGAHNSDGIQVLLDTIGAYAGQDIYLLFTLTREKDYRTIIRQLCVDVQYTGIVVTQVKGSRSLEADILAEEFRKYAACPVVTEENNRVAFLKALDMKNEDSILFAAGSLYMIGDIKRVIEEEQL